MRMTTLAALDDEARRYAINRVYEGYLVPLRLTTEQAAQHFERNDIALAHSPVWLDEDGAPLALAALGLRGERGWIGGFGVAPAARGQGLGRRLLAATLAEAGDLGVRTVQLEALEENVAAIRLYERAGFGQRRWLRIFERAPGAPPDGVSGAVHELAAGAALAATMRLRQELPVWQREPAGLVRLPGLRALATDDPGAPTAVAVYSPGGGDAAILDLAGPPAAVRPLLAALVDRFPTGRLRLSNEPATSPLCAPLEDCGWRETLRQREMTLTLGLN
jgi:ribosomal protein S18 acetylase RimI-like enzyme